MNVQIFGTNKSQETKKALRFFKERSIKPQFVDLKEHSMARGELQHFVQKYGYQALINRQSKAYQRAGLEYMRLSEDDWLERLLEQPELMVQPLLRSGKHLSIGWSEAQWRDIYEASKP